MAPTAVLIWGNKKYLTCEIGYAAISGCHDNMLVWSWFTVTSERRSTQTGNDVILLPLMWSILLCWSSVPAH